LHRALRLQEKAVSYGFDWDETQQLFDKLDEEIAEIKDALSHSDKDRVTEEIGDLLFMAVNLSRFLDVHPEDALERSLTKFGKRFRSMEEMAGKDAKSLADLDLAEMEEYWQKAKNQESGNRNQEPEKG
jgi:uncharacterized protein YabN with tetrapyrrole methylase and pyrophosphatase domain